MAVQFPAILIKTPGTPANAISILDGYTMAQKGQPKRALQVSLVSGVFGGLTSTLIFIVSGTTLAYFGLKFGPGEMFALGIFGLSIIGTFLKKYRQRVFCYWYRFIISNSWNLWFWWNAICF